MKSEAIFGNEIAFSKIGHESPQSFIAAHRNERLKDSLSRMSFSLRNYIAEYWERKYTWRTLSSIIHHYSWLRHDILNNSLSTADHSSFHHFRHTLNCGTAGLQHIWPNIGAPSDSIIDDQSQPISPLLFPPRSRAEATSVEVSTNSSFSSVLYLLHTYYLYLLFRGEGNLVLNQSSDAPAKMRPTSIGKGLRETISYRARFCEHISSDDEKAVPCRQRIYVTCPHCQKPLCLHHINEHQRLMRSLFDALVNRLNEYRHQLTVTLPIPAGDQATVDECLEKFRTVILPDVQRTCCENDVKQKDIDRIQLFIDGMESTVQHIQLYWSRENNQRKRSRSSDVRIWKWNLFEVM